MGRPEHCDGFAGVSIPNVAREAGVWSRRSTDLQDEEGSLLPAIRTPSALGPHGAPPHTTRQEINQGVRLNRHIGSFDE